MSMAGRGIAESRRRGITARTGPGATRGYCALLTTREHEASPIAEGEIEGRSGRARLASKTLLDCRMVQLATSIEIDKTSLRPWRFLREPFFVFAVIVELKSVGTLGLLASTNPGPCRRCYLRCPMSHSVEQHLAVSAAAFDVEIRRFVPSYDAMLDALVEALVDLLPEGAAPRVLDLGAGTGALSARIAARLPAASLTLLDADAAMLARAEERLAAHRERVTLVRGSFFDPLPPCDVAVASLSLHHVRDLDEKRSLYGNVHRALAPGGMLLDADAALSPAPALASRVRRRWAAHLVTSGDTEAQAYARFAEWDRQDRFFGIDEELAALREAGFTAVDVLFRSGPSRVIAALR